MGGVGPLRFLAGTGPRACSSKISLFPQRGLPKEPVPRVSLLGVEANRLAQGTGSSGKPRCAQVPQGTLFPRFLKEPSLPRFLTAPFPRGSFKASQNLLLAFLICKALQALNALQAFKALQARKGEQALKALGFLQSSHKNCFWRSLLGKLCTPSELVFSLSSACL